MEVRNQMSARELKSMHGSIDIVQNPHTGKMFFTCGSITGVVGTKAKEEIHTLGLDDLNYCEVNIEGNWVGCLMKKASNNVLRSL